MALTFVRVADHPDTIHPQVRGTVTSGHLEVFAVYARLPLPDVALTLCGSCGLDSRFREVEFAHHGCPVASVAEVASVPQAEHREDGGIAPRPQPGKWSIAQNLAHLNFGYQYFDTIVSSIAAARAKGIVGNGPFRYRWLSSWFVKSQEPPPKRKYKSANSTARQRDLRLEIWLSRYWPCSRQRVCSPC